MLVFQLLYGPHWRAGVTVRALKDGVKAQQAIETPLDHHYAQCYGRRQCYSEIDDISLKRPRMMRRLMWWRAEQPVVNGKSIVVVQGS